ncbi:diacylglycerol/lipid kinase family protein [Pelagibacterium limicola]|uniref:diacylglycerol/lipid kinase family protein n=1 Tax=Pelagibacterium limicola TaxID=2791022 RepID=UPI0018AFDE46|nr:diacylglycerol kinase family protein [Pelagibacterium limicola]
MGSMMTARRYYFLINGNSGSVAALGLTADRLRDVLAARGIAAVVDAELEGDLAGAVARATASDADIVVAAGGDGTVTALAGAMLGTDKSLGILPLGTANMLARDLNIPLDVDTWIEALEAMQPRAVDVGVVNGRIFLHKVVVGLLPALAAGREYIRGEGGGAILGYCRFFVRRLARTRRIALSVSTDGGLPHAERLQALAIASNAYEEGVGMFFSRSKLDAGKLTLYRLKHLTLGDVIRLSLLMIAGHWQDDEALEIEEAQTVTVMSRKPALKVMLDGEVETLTSPLEFAIVPQGLNILAPPMLSDPGIEPGTTKELAP